MGPAFIRLLARLTDALLPASPPALSGQLSQWFDWNRAIALSKALDTPAPAAPSSVPGYAPAQEYTRVRESLLANFAKELEAVSNKALNNPGDPADCQPFLLQYQNTQRAMQMASGRLRGQLRDLLAQQSPAQARLAELDAVMEATLSPREQTLLSTVPALLAQHFEHLRAAAQSTEDAADIEARPVATGPWLTRFKHHLHSALVAELDIRFQPIEGLLAALAPRQQGRHV